MALYILKLGNPQSPDDTGVPTSIRLIGPFANSEAAVTWATDVANNPHDNPCWNTIEIADDSSSWMRDENTSPPNAFIIQVSTP